uniref:PIN-like protein n=1 Tax=Ditylenchus dipsaci TaxID=166011 RepID=A0A915EG28_9BILA
MAISGIIGGMGVIPGVLIMLRSVPPKHRSVSLGFNGFLVSLFATLPSPIIWELLSITSAYIGIQNVTAKVLVHYMLRIGSGLASLHIWCDSIDFSDHRCVCDLPCKGLKITDSALDEDEENNDGDGMKSARNRGNENQGDSKKKPSKENGTTDEKEPLNDIHLEHKKEESLPLPLHLASTQPESRSNTGSHSKSSSRDYTGQSNKAATRKQSDELNLLRKSSNHIAGPISEL